MRQPAIAMADHAFGLQERPAWSFGHRQVAQHSPSQDPPEGMARRQAMISTLTVRVVRVASSSFDLRRCA